MAEPNPIWGIHVTTAGVEAVLVERTPQAAYRVVDRVNVPVTGDAAAAMAQAARLLGRRGIRGRAVMLALPDADGALTTAKMTPEDSVLATDELKREILDHTPFEQENGDMRYRLAGREGRADRFVVGVMPRDSLNAHVAALASQNLSLIGMGFAGHALVVGARAVGLVGEEGYLVEVLPDRTFVHAVEGPYVHRYVVPFGVDDLAREVARTSGKKADELRRILTSSQTLRADLVHHVAEAAAILVEDVDRVLAYHLEHHLRREDASLADAAAGRVALAGWFANLPALRPALETALGSRLVAADTSANPGHLLDAAGRPSPAGDLAACAGAVGAALEAFGSEGDRLALKQPPVLVPEYHEGPGAGVWVAIGATALAIAAVAVFLPGKEERAADPSRGWANAGGASPGVRAVPAETFDRLRKSLTDRAALVEALRAASRVTGDGRVAAATDVDVTAEGAVAIALRASDAQGSAPEDLRAWVRGRLGPSARDLKVEVQGRSASCTFRTAEWDFRPAAPSDTMVDAGPLLARAEALFGPVGAAPDPGALVRAVAPFGEAEVALDGVRVELTVRVAPSDALRAAHALARARGPFELDAVGAHSTGPGSARVTARAFLLTGSVDRADASGLPAADAEFIQTALAALDLEDPTAPLTLPHEALGLGLEVRPQGTGGTVVLAFGDGVAGRALQHAPADPEAPWRHVRDLPTSAGETADEVRGGSGAYRWRIRYPGPGPEAAGPSVELTVLVDVGVELLGPGDAPGAAAFRLTRTFRGKELATLAEIALGAPISATADGADGAPVALPSGWTLESSGFRIETETRPVAMPRFRPDGRVKRTEAGVPEVEERPAEVPVRVFEAVGRSRSGEARRWLRKMTDG